MINKKTLLSIIFGLMFGALGTYLYTFKYGHRWLSSLTVEKSCSMTSETTSDVYRRYLFDSWRILRYSQYTADSKKNTLDNEYKNLAIFIKDISSKLELSECITDKEGKENILKLISLYGVMSQKYPNKHLASDAKIQKIFDKVFTMYPELTKEQLSRDWTKPF